MPTHLLALSQSDEPACNRNTPKTRRSHGRCWETPFPHCCLWFRGSPKPNRSTAKVFKTAPQTHREPSYLDGSERHGVFGQGKGRICCRFWEGFQFKVKQPKRRAVFSPMKIHWAPESCAMADFRFQGFPIWRLTQIVCQVPVRGWFQFFRLP